MVAHELNQRLGRELVSAADNREMLATVEITLLTVPFGHASTAIESSRNAFRPGSVLVDVTVPVTFEKGRPELLRLPEGSGSQALAAKLPPGVSLVAAFKTIPAKLLADLDAPLDCDVFVCGDAAEAKARVMELIRLIPGLRPVDAGGLEVTGTVERMSVLAVQLNRRYKIKSARFRVVGL